MLNSVRIRLRGRYENQIRPLLSDCIYEHILGVTAILTEKCKVWWSKEFEIPSEVRP